MKVLLDEMLTGLKDHLDILGWDVSTVDDIGLKGSDDKNIAQYAYDNDFILVSEDRKPIEFLKLLGGRYLHVDSTMIVRTIMKELEEKYPE
jgi:predicted nuclease of predicted toxin-antitoxin system